ncbi:MAG: LLM class flavin-dependent oxidoreductase, partial [Chloroflexi bacterium]|nr:LLM class flavin-dependent oxidoreductase [Chloroflexota bacterium]
MRFALRVHQGGWSFGQLRELWQAADRLGYDGVALNDLLGVDGPECWTALTALGAPAERLWSIPLVSSAPYRHPALVAKMAATLDQATGGRVLLGLGAGGSGSDARAFGVPWAPLRQRVAALDEAIDVLRLLWRGGGTYTGAHYQLADAKGAPAPVQLGGPPILVGGHGERYVLPAVARKADFCNIGFDLDVASWGRQRALLDELARAAGRAPDAVRLTHNATVVIAEDAVGVDAGVQRL